LSKLLKFSCQILLSFLLWLSETSDSTINEDYLMVIGYD